MALIDRAKSYLGISHNAKDAEINANIATARAELIRLGILASVANGSDALVEDAALQFVMSRMAASRNEEYAAAWEYQKDCLRRTSAYTEEPADDE